MKYKIMICAAGLLLSLAFVAGSSRAADIPVPAAACGAGIGEYQRIAMHRIAQRSERDPSGLWTDYELWNVNTPHKTDVWEGSFRNCQGQRIVVSQIVNRQCSSATVCPVRVVVRDEAGAGRVLLNYKQACTLHGTFALRRDGHQLMACDVPFDFD
jgi:hypothetical protein